MTESLRRFSGKEPVEWHASPRISIAPGLFLSPEGIAKRLADGEKEFVMGLKSLALYLLLHSVSLKSDDCIVLGLLFVLPFKNRLFEVFVQGAVDVLSSAILRYNSN